jgi:uncharacterized membrane protein
MGEELNNQESQTMEKENIPQNLEEAIGPVISSSQLSNEQKVEKVGHLVARMIAISQESFSGPMPHPDILKGYKLLIPDAPDRILHMAEEEQKHRIEVENKLLEQNNKNITESAKANLRSQIIACILAIVLVVSGVTLTILGHSVVGGTIFSTTIIGVIAVFITGKSGRNVKKEEKQDS